MINQVLKYSLLFISLVLFQVLAANNMGIYEGAAIPFVYVLFLLLLPIEIAPILLLFVAFFTGMAVDMFGNTLGMHVSAALVVAFIRPAILSAIAPRDGYEFGVKPDVHSMGITWFITYGVIMLLIHHFVLFSLEYYTLAKVPLAFLKALGSTVYSLLLILLIQYIFLKPKS